MKKLFVILAVSCFATTAFAQTEQGAFRIGGAADLSFLNTKVEGASDSSNEIDLGIDAGYFVIDNLSVNLGVNFTNTTMGNTGSTAFGGELGVRYYFPPKVFVDAGFDVFNTKVKGSDSVTGTGLNLTAGYAAFITDNIAVEPTIGYRLGLSDKDKGTQADGFGVGVGFGLYF